MSVSKFRFDTYRLSVLEKYKVYVVLLTIYHGGGKQIWEDSLTKDTSIDDVVGVFSVSSPYDRNPINFHIHFSTSYK